MKISPVAAELFHADGQTDTKKLTVAFVNFANAPIISVDRCEFFILEIFSSKFVPSFI